jgi:hypothetical protein
MNLAPIPLAAVHAHDRCIVRANRIVRVKFIGLPAETQPEAARWGTRASGGWRSVLRFLSRVIGRLVAARP